MRIKIIFDWRVQRAGIGEFTRHCRSNPIADYTRAGLSVYIIIVYASSGGTVDFCIMFKRITILLKNLIPT